VVDGWRVVVVVVPLPAGPPGAGLVFDSTLFAKAFQGAAELTPMAETKRITAWRPDSAAERLEPHSSRHMAQACTQDESQDVDDEGGEEGEQLSFIDDRLWGQPPGLATRQFFCEGRATAPTFDPAAGRDDPWEDHVCFVLHGLTDVAVHFEDTGPTAHAFQGGGGGFGAAGADLQDRTPTLRDACVKTAWGTEGTFATVWAPHRSDIHLCASRLVSAAWAWARDGQEVPPVLARTLQFDEMSRVFPQDVGERAAREEAWTEAMQRRPAATARLLTRFFRFITGLFTRLKPDRVLTLGGAPADSAAELDRWVQGQRGVC